MCTPTTYHHFDPKIVHIIIKILQYIVWMFQLARLPDNLYCVGGDVKPCSVKQSIKVTSFKDRVVMLCSTQTDQQYDTIR